MVLTAIPEVVLTLMLRGMILFIGFAFVTADKYLIGLYPISDNCGRE